MIEIFNGIDMMAAVSALCMVLVIVAMAADLVSGWHKAKIRGEARTSYGFSRTLTKFLLYEGILLVSTCIDVIIKVAVWQFGTVMLVPLVTLLAAAVLCFVEMWSIREKAEDKTRSRIDKALQTIVSVIGKDKVIELVEELTKGTEDEDVTEG